jgi:hypothetical protein
VILISFFGQREARENGIANADALLKKDSL